MKEINPVSETSTAIATILRSRVAALKLSISDLAERANISRSTIHRLLQGDREIRVGDLSAMCKVLDLDAAKVFEQARDLALLETLNGGV